MADESQSGKGCCYLAAIGCALLFGLIFVAVVFAFISYYRGSMSGSGWIDKPTSLGGGPGQSASSVGCNNVPDYKQCDSKWKSESYNCSPSTTICSSGCGVTSAADVLSFYGKSVDPVQMAKESMAHGYRACGSGTSHGFFPYIAGKYGLHDENGISWDRAMQLLKEGKPIIVSGQGPKPFTGGGHFVVMTCYNSDGTISVNDPYWSSASYPEAHIRAHEHFLTAIY